MIITPHNCIYYESNDNLNKTCKLKNKRCVLITDQKQCCKYIVRKDLGFWDIHGNYVQDIQEINKMDMDKYFEDLNDTVRDAFEPTEEEIIIDGVDVAECKHFWNIKDAKNLELCKINFDNNYFSNGLPLAEKCKEHNNCYYKQLKRLEQKNAELKVENERLKEEVEMDGEYLDKKLEQYRKTLQEIKAIVCGNYEIIDPQGRKDIINLITKAEEE